MKMSISDIARLANTSRGTVDRVVNGRGKVSKELEKRIKDIIEANGYEVNGSARALSLSKNKYLVGVVINSIGNPFFNRVKEGIEDSLKKWEDYGLEIYYKEIRGYNEQEQIEAIDDVVAHGANVLALTPINTEAIINKLNSLTIPIVTFNNDLRLDKKFAYVGCDHVEGGKLCGDLANLMLNDGDDVAVVTGSLKILGNRQRVENFSEVLENKHCSITIIENNDDDEESYAKVRELLQTKSPALIYFAAGGSQGGLKAIEESGKKMKILTVDETRAVIEGIKKGLISATIAQQPYEQGRMTVNIIAQFLYFKKLPLHKHNFTKNIVVFPSALK